jgi:hypothetical protein
MEEKVTLITKRKNIQIVIDYCLDVQIPFSVSPRGISPDEFETDLTISGIKQGVALGMFAKEHKFEVSGLGETTRPKSNGNSSAKKVEPKDPEVNTKPLDEKAGSASLLNF